MLNSVTGRPMVFARSRRKPRFSTAALIGPILDCQHPVEHRLSDNPNKPGPGSVPGKPNRASQVAPRIIVIGASAGGLQGLRDLVSWLPTDLAAAVLVVLHTPPYGTSVLHEVLSSAGTLPAKQGTNGEKILAGQVYVASPDRHLMVENGCVRLTGAPKESFTRPSVNVLFRSAAYDMGHRVIGVVMSGMLDDGAAGLWAIKDRGGIAMVQSPREARWKSMPQSALQQVDVDYCLTVEKIAKTLASITVGGSGVPKKVADMAPTDD